MLLVVVIVDILEYVVVVRGFVIRLFVIIFLLIVFFKGVIVVRVFEIWVWIV